MLLPLLFLPWLWGHVGLSVKAGPKSGHQATALVKIALVYLALVYTLATTLVVALPTPVVHDIDIFGKAGRLVTKSISIVTGDVGSRAEFSASRRQDSDPTKYCTVHPTYRECLPNHTPGAGGCQLYPSRKCPPPPPKKGSNPGGGNPGHNATADDVVTAKVSATAHDQTATHLDAAMGSTERSKGVQLHHSAIKKAITPAGSNEPTAAELTLAEPLLKGRHEKAGLIERAFAWLLQEKAKPAEMKAVVVQKGGSPVKMEGLLGGDEEHH